MFASHRGRRAGLAAFVAGALFASAACSSSSEEETSEGGTPTTLRVAFGSQPDFTAISNFKWIEDLEAEGIEVEELYFESSQDAFRALVAGEADVAPTGIVSAILLNTTAGEDMRVVANDLKAPDHLLITTPDITSSAQLEGEKIGISTPGDISDSLTRLVLNLQDVDTSKVSFVEIGGTSARVQALLSGQISGGLAHAAEGLAAAEQGGLNNLFPVGETVTDYLQHGLMTTQSYIDQHPEFVQTLVDAFVDSTRWAAENKEEYIELSKEHVEGLNADIRSQAYDIFTDIGMFAVNGGMDPELLENTVDIEESVGTFGDEEPIGIEEWTDSSFVEDYLERNGDL